MQSELECFTYKEKCEDSRQTGVYWVKATKKTFLYPSFITIQQIWINRMDQIIVLFT
jgi:hypothetical protein